MMKLFTALLVAGDQIINAQETCDGTEELKDATVSCDGKSMNITIPKCAFDNLGNIDAAEAFINGPSDQTTDSSAIDGLPNNCKGVHVGSNYEFKLALDQCNMKSGSNETHISYENAVQVIQGSSNSVITRRRSIAVDFQCDFQIEQFLTLANGFSPTLTNVEVDMGSELGHFHVEMGLFTDNTFAEAATGVLDLQVPDPIFVQVSSDDLNVQLKTCWATPGSDSTMDPKYEFISDFCGTEDGYMQIFQNGVPKAQFSLDSFQFNGHENNEIYVHCTVKLCDETGGTSCATSCDSSRRRRRRSDDNGAKLISVGPITINP